MSLQHKQNVVVIGSGIAGLSAAYELQKANYDVTILESAHLAGGRMAEEMVGSYLKETGAMGLNSYYLEMFDLCRELGVMDQVVELPRFGTGTITDLDITFDMSNNPSKWDMLSSPALSWKSKIKLANLLPPLWSARRNVDPCLIHTAAHLDDESMSSYLTRKVGSDFLENVASPLLNVALAWNVDTTSKAAFLAKVAHISESNGYVFKEGISYLTRLLAGMMDVRLNSRVTRITRSTTGVSRIVHYDSPEGPQVIEADLVVCAIPGDKVTAVVENQASWETSFFDQGVPYAQYAMMVYVLREQLENPDGMYFVRNTPTPLNFYKTYNGDPEQEGRPPYLWAAFSPERLSHYFAEDGSDFEELALQYVKEYYPTIEEETVQTIKQWDGYRMPEFPVGQIRRVQDFLFTQESGPKNLYYVGDYLGGAGTGNALAIGRRTGRIIVDHWRRCH